MNADSPYDLLVVGGGINGVGIARDAAGRGLRVLLCEQDDLASHTSSASTKLIHGGLRYLEYYEFGLVRKALRERELLLRAAPHLISPLRFVMPHVPHLRPAWMIRAGLFLYDHLSRRELLPASSGVNLRTHAVGVPLQKSMTRGFLYSDAWVDDARLVVANAQDARERGAVILTRTRLESAQRSGGLWQASLRSTGSDTAGSLRQVQARALVNAAGPWVAQVLHEQLGQTQEHSLRLIKGSHLVVKKMFEHDHAYIFQNPDGRIIFAIPYQEQFTLIGTTDLEYHGDPAAVHIDAAEVAYLCKSVNRYFLQSIGPADVVASYSGVRPLLDQGAGEDPSAVTRDYHLELSQLPQQAALLTVFGGKITTYRRLAEEALDLLGMPLACAEPAWTAHATLPGGDIPAADFAAFSRQFQTRYPWLPTALAMRYARSYGTRAELLIGERASVAELGAQFCADLHEAEVMYLQEYEWAVTADDILWRRTKLGLHATPAQQSELAAYLVRAPTHIIKPGDDDAQGNVR